MHNQHGTAIGTLLVGFVIACALALPAAAQEQSNDPCQLTEADKVANAKLTFDQFDQVGVTPTTWRQLSNHGCAAKAVEAAEDFLIHGRFTSPREQHAVIFHIAQSLAMDDKNEAAALMVASSKYPASELPTELDWNTYADGTWAFLRKDREALAKAQMTLAAETGKGNKINSEALAGLLNCFSRPYLEAYQTKCRTSK